MFEFRQTVQFIIYFNGNRFFITDTNVIQLAHWDRSWLLPA